MGDNKDEEIINYMERYKIDILALQETKRPTSDKFQKRGFTFMFSSSELTKVELPVNRKGKGKAKGQAKGRGKGKRKERWKTNEDNNRA